MLRKSWEALASAVAIAGSLIGTTAGQAADLGRDPYAKGSVKDYGAAVERPSIGNWGGIYFGVNVGAAWDSYTSDYQRFNTGAHTDLPRYTSSDSNGILGGHIGVQHQMGRIVVGIEGGWSGKGGFGHDYHGEKCFAAAGGSDYHCQARINSIFTLGPRLGLAHGNTLFYVTGGYASGQIHSREFDPRNFAGIGTENWRWVDRHHGWFIGAGAEMVMRDRWLLGLEYQHIELDQQTHWRPAVAALSRQIDGEADIVRVRLSYKFGRGDGGHTDQPLK